jgi:hypothetical protein
MHFSCEWVDLDGYRCNLSLVASEKAEHINVGAGRGLDVLF